MPFLLLLVPGESLLAVVHVLIFFGLIAPVILLYCFKRNLQSIWSAWGMS